MLRKGRKMQKIKQMIILIIILIIAIIMTILVMNRHSQEEQAIVGNTYSQENSQLQKAKNPHLYFTVKSCAEQYLSYLFQADNQAILRMLDSRYIQQFGINEQNVQQYVEKINTPIILTIDQMYWTEQDATHHQYYIKGNITEDTLQEENNQEKEWIITVNLDLENQIFSIIPFGYGGPFYEEK